MNESSEREVAVFAAARQLPVGERAAYSDHTFVTVSEPGELGCPKVIDFGIAKATSGQCQTDNLP